MLVSCTFLPEYRISSIYLLMCVNILLYVCFFYYYYLNALLSTLLLTVFLLQLHLPSKISLLIFFVVIVSIYT